MKAKSIFGLAVAGCLALAGSGSTQEDKDVQLSDFKLGEHVSGEKTDLSKLDGKVVVIDFWGTL